MLNTERTLIDIAKVEDAQLLLNYYQENSDHLSAWEPLRAADFFTILHWQHKINELRNAFEKDREYCFVAFNKERSEVLAVCNFSGVNFGPFQACYLGFSVAKKYEGQGLMFEILAATISYIFEKVGLNRIMANYQPHNLRSEQLLKKLGFEREGYARCYLNIAGIWQDHILTSKINDSTTIKY